MLTAVEVRKDNGTLLQLPLEDISNGFAIEDIEGLDPVKATLVSSSFAQIDGEQYHSSRRETRNLKFTISLEPDYVDSDVKALRTKLYNFFMPKSRASYRFIDSSGLYVDISGRVETFTSPQFTDKPKAIISVLCFDPDFYDPNPVEISGSTVETTVDTEIDYLGEVESGVEITLNVDRALSEFTVYCLTPDNEQLSMQFAASLVAGDVVYINTIPGSKKVSLTTSGVTSSALYSVSPYSSWITLYPGSNFFRIYAEGTAIPYTVSYTTKYGGL